MIGIAFALLLAQATPPAAAPVNASNGQIQHTPLEKATRGQSPILHMETQNSSDVFAPLVFARVSGTRRYFGYPMSNHNHANWTARLPVSLTSGASFEYFIEVRTRDGSRSDVGSENKPFLVTIEEPVILMASVEVESAPGAIVSLDGKEIGPAPRKVDALEGRHLLAVALPDGRGAEQSVEFSAKKVKKLTITPSGDGGPGKLEIASDPRGARVYLDGSQLGTTPYEGDVIAGKHVLALELEGYIREEREIEFHFGHDVDLRFSLKALPKEPALSIESTPDRAEVYIDGTQRGNTPYLAPMKAGPHEVVLKMAGHSDAASDFEMPSDRDLSLRMQLNEAINPAPRLVIYSRPDGAALRIDGKDSGVTPWSGEITEGKHKIAISADGFLPEEREVKAEKNREADVSFVLQRPPGPAKLSIETEPAEGVEITIDGTVAGITPLKAPIQLDPGEHQVLARLATYRTLAQTVSVEQGQSTALKLSLSVAPKEPLPPTIALNTEPTGARAYVDNKLVGETPVRVKSVPGPHELKLLLDGYIGRSSKIVLPADSGFELRVAVSLKRVRGFEQLTRPDPLALARAQVTRALACYRLADFACALAAYRAAYEIKPIPDLLFNIAQTERKIGHLDKAIVAYKAFLAEKKTGAVAEVARQHLAQCEQALARGETRVADEGEAVPTAPSLVHDPVLHTVRGKDLRLTATVKADKGGLGTVQACFRAVIGDFECLALTKGDASAPDQYAVVIPAASVVDGLEYYLEAFDADNSQASRSGNKMNPIAVKMDDDVAAPAPLTKAASAPMVAVLAPPPPEHRLPAALPYAVAGAAALSMGVGGIFYAEGKSASNDLSSSTHTNAEVQTLTTRVDNDQNRANVFLGLGIGLVAVAAGLLAWDHF